jgi:DNA modification methylase
MVACVQLGRDCVGIEREPEYAEIARARIAAATRQGKLAL